ncbi:MAG: IS30 family transposase [Phycisphaerae bacterium]
MHGHHLTLQDREILAQERAAGRSHAAIARRLGCNRSTIWRELKRNGGAFGMYLPSRAQALADRRRRRSKRPWKLEGTDLGRRVQESLRQYWSPEQIAGRLRREHPDRPDRWVSHQCIYDWIERQRASGGTWHRCLRRRGRRYRRRGGPEKRGRIVGRVGIEDRPPEVAARARLGDWESDTLSGSRSRACLATHVERVSRYTVLAKLSDRTAKRFNAGTVSAFARHGDLPRRTLNGYAESFHSRLRDELLNAEVFEGLRDAKALAAGWKNEYNHRRPHSSLEYRTPAAFAATLDTEMVTQEEEIAEACSAASPAGPPVGASPLPPAQPAEESGTRTLIAVGT